MQSNASDIWHFSFYSKEKVKIGPKNWFSSLFWERFPLRPLAPSGYAQISCQIKFLMNIHNRGKFHHYSFCGSQVINFQMFSWQCSIHEIALFEKFLGFFSPKYSSILLTFSPEVVYYKTKTVCKQSFKFECLSTNRTYPKFKALVHFRAHFTPGKQKILPKTKIFPETSFLGLLNYTVPSPR